MNTKTMRTPNGKECQYYYSDYFRGKSTEECRLIQANPDSAPWRAALCGTCPVPDILLANACPHLALRGHVGKSLFGLIQKIEVQAACREQRVPVSKPHVGCGHCHEYLDRVAESSGR